MARRHYHFPVLIPWFGPRAIVAIRSMRAWHGPMPQPSWHRSDLLTRGRP
jgi:hypothetical protein